MATALDLQAHTRRLLIVQRNEFVARSLARHLKDRFSVVELATSEQQAEEIFGDTARTPTHLVCGQNFGPGQDTGSAMIRGWRSRHPALELVVLLTAETELPGIIEGVDRVMNKPTDMSELVTLLSFTGLQQA